MNENKNDGAATASETAVRWLSEGLEELILECGNEDKATQEKPDFDVVIVGSGYGGALAADALAGVVDQETKQPIRVCVLERGREYLAGMFPSSESDLPGSVTFTAPNSPDPYASTDGVMDLRLGEDVTVMLASGLGGGSLINAGVMAIPKGWVFNQPCWPKSLQQRASLVPYYREARKKLSPKRDERFSKPMAVKKRAALFRLEPKDKKVHSAFHVQGPRTVASTIAAEATTNAAGVRLNACKRCGDCMTGCNHRAKNSLDQNLLVKAKLRGARIICGASVVRLERSDAKDKLSPWLLQIVHTDPLLRRRQQKAFVLSTRRVILAAGTLGSTEILLRSKSLKFSSQLGHRFSTNGDFIAASYGEHEEVNAVASEFQPPEEREVGPTITGMMMVGKGEDQITIEELAIPGPLHRLFAEGYTTAHLFHRLGTRDPEGRHRPLQGGVDPYAVQSHKIARTQALGVIGHDGAGGRLELRRSKDRPDEAGPSPGKRVVVRWPEMRQRGGIFDKQVHTLTKLIETSRNGGVLLSNPFWQLLPPRLTEMLDMPRGPAFTTHPLGGCAMADTWHDGVVNEYGQVFDTATPQSVHLGLVVLDGSIIPRSLGTNPAFTISAIVLRALEKLKAEWNWPFTAPYLNPVKGLPPSYKTPVTASDIPTKVAICERLEGPLHLTADSKKHGELMLELTLRFSPTSVCELATSMARTLEVDPNPAASFIRVFKKKVLRGLRDEGVSEYRCDQLASFRASLTGTMRLLDRERSSKPGRILRGLYAWFLNRGMRDIYGRVVEFIAGRSSLGAIANYVSSIAQAASHAGEARLFEYDLLVGDSLPPEDGRSRADPLVIPKGTRIRGTKRLTYKRRSNPWTQMQEVTLTDISPPENIGANTRWFLQLSRWRRTVLTLEPKHYAREQKHLFEITQARDGAAGLFDLFSFVLYVTRVVAAVHLWSFRKPDEPPSRRPQRLPGRLPDVRPPDITNLQIKTRDDEGKETQVTVRLTRYRKDGAGFRKNGAVFEKDKGMLPVLLIHGYSASGTTFAHPALQPGLAKYLYRENRDVWVADLRTSAGLASRKRSWDFEQVAREDIPEVVRHILAETGAPKIDAVAHCMGAAMLSMALLDAHSPIVNQVRNVVLSQVGPMVSFMPANIFRAYAMSYIEQVFRESNFEFRPTGGVGSAFLDRLLATVPYPPEEFDFENPLNPRKRTTFTANRHRIDALFGRAFNVANMHEDVLDHIDDFFGGVNLRTLFQTIHFSRNGMITTRGGGNAFIIPARLKMLRTISFMSIHGADNGLADPATLVRVERLMKESGITFEKLPLLKGLGHQDCIMGREATTKVFPKILEFLNRPELSSGVAATGKTATKCTAHLPFMGPLVGLPDSKNEVAVAFAAGSKSGPPQMAVWIPAGNINEAWRTKVLGEARTGIPTTWRTDNLSQITPQYARDHLEKPLWYSLPAPSDMPRGSVLVLIGDMPGATSRGHYYGAMLTPSAAPNFPRLPTQQADEAAARALRDLLRRTTLEELKHAQVILPHPSKEVDHLRFALSSCQYPAGPLDPGLAAASYTRLGRYLDASDRRPRCAVLMGDQVYADATAGLFDPTRVDDRYELPYQEWLRMPAVRDVLRRLPLYAIFDDHEIDNNWEPHMRPGRGVDMNLKMGLEAYFRVQRAAGPEVPKHGAKGTIPAWYETKIDGFDFFFVDARSERQKRTIARLHLNHLIRRKQWLSLSKWLNQPDSDRPRFVVSAPILLPRRKASGYGCAGAITSDAWDGYPASFHRLLAYIANRKLRNLVFLSGDEHHSCIATARLFALDPSYEEQCVLDKNYEKQFALAKDYEKLAVQTTLHSIHSSALNAPFPFANGEPANLAGCDFFSFPNPEKSARYPAARIGCAVTTHFVTERGDGFAMLDCKPNGKLGWQIRCEFSRPDRSQVYLLDPASCRGV